MGFKMCRCSQFVQSLYDREGPLYILGQGEGGGEGGEGGGKEGKREKEGVAGAYSTLLSNIHVLCINEICMRTFDCIFTLGFNEGFLVIILGFVVLT